MASQFPTNVVTTSNIPNFVGSNTLSADNHAGRSNDLRDEVIALETKVGANGSAVTTTHDYKLNEVTGTDKSVGKTATQTLTNKTLTNPVINVGSDATGDMYYRNSSGVLVRLPAGSTGQVVTISGGVPVYQTPASAADASYAAKGVVQFQTDAATSGVVVASGVASINSGTGANQIVKLNASSQLPAVSGALLTGVPKILYKDSTLTAATAVLATPITQAIAANTLSAGGVLKGKVYCDFTNGSPSTFTVNVKYGGTAIATFSSSTVNQVGSVCFSYMMQVVSSTTATLEVITQRAITSPVAINDVSGSISYAQVIPSTASSQNLTVDVIITNGGGNYRGSFAEYL